MATDPVLEQIDRIDSLVEVVLERITKAIITGRLRPGEHLRETQLSEQLNVSRGPIREAIRRLEQMGLVEKIPYRGTYVSQLTRRDVRELASIREPLEGLAARLLAERRDPDTIRALHGQLQALRDAASSDDLARIAILDADFHDQLVQLADHRLLRELWFTVGVKMRHYMLLKPHPNLSIAPVLHEPIVAAIEAGDAERAEVEARRHVRDAYVTLGEWYDALPEDSVRS